jgi:alpha-tubulin suppressor-like RCC1 family protein
LNFNGQAGLGSNVNVLVPTQVLDIGEVKTVSLGYYHTCAVASPNDSTYCFGFNSQGQLGLGNIEDQNRPQKVNLGFPAQTVATGRDHTCAILLSGVLKV